MIAGPALAVTGAVNTHLLLLNGILSIFFSFACFAKAPSKTHAKPAAKAQEKAAPLARPKAFSYSEFRQQLARLEWTVENINLGFKLVPRPQMEFADSYHRPDTRTHNCFSRFPSHLRGILRRPLTVQALGRTCPFLDLRRYSVTPRVGVFTMNVDIQTTITLAEEQRQFGILSYRNRQIAYLPTWAFDIAQTEEEETFRVDQTVEVTLLDRRKVKCIRNYELKTLPVQQMEDQGVAEAVLMLKMRAGVVCELQATKKNERPEVFREVTVAWISGPASEGGPRHRSSPIIDGEDRGQGSAEPLGALKNSVVHLKFWYQDREFSAEEAMNQGFSPLLLYYHLPIPQFGYMDIPEGDE